MKHLTKAIINDIIVDFINWKNYELEVATRAGIESTIINTLTSLNLSTLNTDHGFKLVSDLLNMRNEAQGTASRMRRFVASCMLKHGMDAVNEYISICHSTMKTVYGLDQKTINKMSSVNPCFWMCVMFTII
jgi:hypothetical protein